MRRDGCAGAAETMLITFKAVTVARRAVAKLHRKKIKTAEGPHALWARQLGGEGATPISPLSIMQRDGREPS